MYEVVIKGFKTKKEAQEFYAWYNNQGEQDIGIWWEVHFPDKELGPVVNNEIPAKWNGKQYEFTIKES